MAGFVNPGDPVTLTQAETKKEIATAVTLGDGAVVEPVVVPQRTGDAGAAP